MTHTAEPMDDNRRQLLVATSVVGGAGAVALAAPKGHSSAVTG